jgi:hypothetical protein
VDEPAGPLFESPEELREREPLSDALPAELLASDEFLIAEPPPDEPLVVEPLPVELAPDELLDLLLELESLVLLVEVALLDDPLLPESELPDLLLELELDELLPDDPLLPESELLLLDLLDCEPESLLDLLLDELELLLLLEPAFPF